MNAFPADEQDGLESPNGENVAVLDLVKDLTDLRPAIEDQEALAGCTPEQRRRLSPLVKLTEQLQALTEWTRNDLLDNIGCKSRDPHNLAEDEAKVKRCMRFLGLILETTRPVETVPARRSVVRGCARLSGEAKEALREVEGLRRILGAGKVSAFDYIELGEISAALRTARVVAGVERPGTANGPSPYDSAPVVHLSIPRVDLYVRGKRDVLGRKTFGNMEGHIAGCEACKHAVEARQAFVHTHTR